MSESKETVELQHELQQADTLCDYKILNEAEFIESSLSEFLYQMLIKYNLERKDVIKRAQLDHIYSYQIFDGRKSPKRNKIIQLAFGFPLTLDETQRALKLGGVNELYPRIKRDACIIFALAKKYSIMQVNELLFSEQEEVLNM